MTPLVTILEEARARGFLGPGPIEDHIQHAAPLIPHLPAGRVVDLGAGGGVPGLVLAVARPDVAWVFVESQERRARWLAEAVARLGLGAVTVRMERAEETGRSELRATADAVTARSFGPPAVTAECAAPLLRVGGVLWVAEPPERRTGRWPEEELAELGLSGVTQRVGGWAGLEQRQPCPERYPRRVGIPAKRPLFSGSAQAGGFHVKPR